MHTILLLENDESLRRGISFKLEREGFHVLSAGSIREGKAYLKANEIQLILCDIMLDDGSGLSFCQYVREELLSDIHFIFLTAMDTEIDIVMGYETGADDYITKPFSLAVLMSKINSIFKRIPSGHPNMTHSHKSASKCTNKTADQKESPVIKSGCLLYHPNEMQLFVDQESVELTRNEYKLLQLFLNHPKQILSKTQILEQMFDIDGNYVDDNTVAVNIRRLREKIKDTGSKRMIKNIRGLGYVWDLEVE